MPPFDAASLGLDAASAAVAERSRERRRRLAAAPDVRAAAAAQRHAPAHTAFDAIQRRAGGKLRRVGGLGLDLRLRRSGRRAPRRARGGRRLGRVAAAEVALQRPRRAAGRRLLLHQRHGVARRSARRATAPSATSTGKMLGDGVVLRGEKRRRVLVVTALPTDADHFRRILAPGRRGADRGPHRAACRTCSCRARARASCSPP